MDDPTAAAARRATRGRAAGSLPAEGSTAQYIVDLEAQHRNPGLLDAVEGAFAELDGADGPDNIARPLTSDHDPECTYRVVRDSGTVMAFHPCDVELTLQTTLFTATFEIRGHTGIDHLWQLLLHYATAWEHNPILAVLPSVSPLPADAYNNQMRLDIDLDADVGAIACNVSRGLPDGGELWFTRGDGPPQGATAPRLVTDYCNGHESAFPADAAVPADLIRRAIHQFYDLNGAGLPACVHWQRSPQVRW